ncbi:MAG: DegT/DnrJ/EryC1/StrS family aminotransferase [Acidobacteria bacterium]|nr:DegT/DnrJ/EryC1/StrS family aminotransferase [Acidobacteriota bacterium]
MDKHVTRRRFLVAAPAAGLATASAKVPAPAAKSALLGGQPVRTQRFPAWPVFDQKEERALLEALRSGKWFRGYGDAERVVPRFEQAWARLTGAKFCLATSSGTGALQTSLAALGVGPGEEVILPPYTFTATLNVILNMYALPVFVDSDLETAQIDARKIEAAITDRTTAMIPVHLAGNVADLDTIVAVARKRKIAVVEDTCQSHLAEWRGRKAGTYGATGCFSFQASKNLNCGEGGAILTNDEELLEKCFAQHWNGGARSEKYSDLLHGSKFLMSEFQAAMLLAQMTRLEEQTKTRGQNAQYLTSLLREIPGIVPARMYDGCTRNAYHGLIFRYRKEQFAGLPRAKFLKALSAEGIPASSGYTPLNKKQYLKNALNSRGYRRIYSKPQMARLEERNLCPVNDQLCEEAVWIMQSVLLGGRGDMEQIGQAVQKIQAHAGELVRA